jgi:Na+-driven multidrug efflux pump
MAALTLAAAPAVALAACAGPLLRAAFAVDPAAAAAAGRWAAVCALGLWPALMFEVTQRLLAAQGLTWPPAAAAAAAAAAHIAANAGLVGAAGLGLDGAAAAHAATQALVMIGYSRVPRSACMHLFRSRGNACSLSCIVMYVCVCRILSCTPAACRVWLYTLAVCRVSY